MKNRETIADELYYKLSKFADLHMMDSEGNVTDTIDEAVIFEVNYGTTTNTKIITFNMFDPEVLEMLYSDNITDGMRGDERKKFYSFVDEMRDFANTRMMNWTVEPYTKARFDKNDFDLKRNNSTYDHKDARMESKMYGSRRSSYTEQANTRLIVRHNRPIDEEVQGSRSRNIKSIYIENAAGERFLVPRNHMPTARAMARHVANEGAINDDIAEAIVEMHDEMKALSKFNRKARDTSNMMEGAAEVLEASKCRYKKVKNTLESLQKQKGYSTFAESFAVSSQLDEEDTFESLRDTLTKKIYNEEFDDVLPYLNRAIAEKQEMDVAENEKKIEERAQNVLRMESLTLDGNPDIDESLRAQVSEMIEEMQMMQFESEDAKKTAVKETQKTVLEFFNENVLSRTDEFNEALDLENRVDEGMAKHMFMLWNNGSVGYNQPTVTESELGVFENWVDELGGNDDDISSETENAADELMQFGYDIGNTHAHYDFIMHTGELLRDNEFDALEDYVMSADEEARDKAIDVMMDAGTNLSDMVQAWENDPEADVETGDEDMDVEEGYTVFPELTDHEKERYKNRDAEGLEGPFRLKSGKFVYYDKQAGKYYDPDSDFFMSDEDYFAHDKPERFNESDEADDDMEYMKKIAGLK